MSLRYASDLTNREWSLIAPYMPPPLAVDRVLYSATTQLVQHPDTSYQTMRRHSPIFEVEHSQIARVAGRWRSGQRVDLATNLAPRPPGAARRDV
jgi:hypothetical protein